MFGLVLGPLLSWEGDGSEEANIFSSWRQAELDNGS
jgi:hypothetical protein